MRVDSSFGWVSGRRPAAHRMVAACAAAAMLLVWIPSSTADSAAGKRPASRFLKLRVTNRMYAEFQDTFTVAMNTKHEVGDTEFSCEAIEFYPQFAFNDSTKTVVSLSDEPKNPAFKIRVFENDEKKEDTWAFYGIQVPHFARTSLLAFEVLKFEYRGKVIGADKGAAPKSKGKAKHR